MENDMSIICNSIIQTCQSLLENKNTDKKIEHCLILTYYKLLCIQNKFPIKNDIMDYLSLGIILLHSNEYCNSNSSSPETSSSEENF